MCLGELVEFGLTQEILAQPTKKQTKDYIIRRIG